MPATSIRTATMRAALSFGIAAVMWFSHLDMARAVAAEHLDYTAAIAAVQTARDRDHRVRSLSRKLESIAADLARIQPPGAAKPSAADVQAGVGETEPNALTLRVLADVDELGDFESEIEEDWTAEAEQMTADGVNAEVVSRHAALLAEVLQRSQEFRSLISPLRDTGASIAEVSSSLANLSDWFAQQSRARAWKAIDKDALPTSFARAEDGAAPQEPDFDGAVETSVVIAAPGPEFLAETLDAKFTPAIVALAQSLEGNPVKIRNWVYDNIEFHPSFGSVQGADQTLLSRRGNAFDIASLTLALLRTSGVPSRYAKSVIQIPIAEVQNWLGNVATPQMAIDLMQKGGIPTASVVTGGRIVAARFEHVWVEAWVDFVPSRGAINRVPDQWVPFEVAFKQFDYVQAYPWRQHTLEARRTIGQNFADGIQVDATGGITGFNFDEMNRATGVLAQQLGNEMYAAIPNVTTGSFRDRRTIRPINSLILAGALPYPLRSTTIARYAELPVALRQTIEIRFYADESSLRYESPSAEISVPMVRLGKHHFGVEYAPATTADSQAFASYAASHAASLPLAQINVIPRLMLDDEVLWQSGTTRMGTMHYWHIDVRDAGGRRTTTEAYQFAAGSTFALVPDLVGMDPARVGREGADLPDMASLPTRDALYYGGLLYWAIADNLEEEASRSSDAVALRLPSIGAFAQSYEISYFFGVPRSGFIAGQVTDIKAARLGLTVKNEDDRRQLSLHIGSAGSMAEGAIWPLLTGTERQGLGISASTVIKLAIDNGQRIFQIDRSNLNVALGQLHLSSFAEDEIRQSVDAGLIAIAPEREVSIGRWSGAGYVIYDPQTGSSLQRIEGGLAGGINVGCILVAVSLAILCNTRLIAALESFLFRYAKRFALFQVIASAAAALFAPILPALLVIDAVLYTIGIAQAVYEVSMWLNSIINEWGSLTPEEKAQLGIDTINNIACSYVPPCLRKFASFLGIDLSAGAIADGLGFSGGDGSDDDDRGGDTPRGNPVAIGSGVKWQTESDYHGDGAFPLHFERTYMSAVPNLSGFVGAKWSASYFQNLRLPQSLDGSPFPTDERPNSVLIVREDGGWVQFNWQGSAYVAESNVPGRLERQVSGATTTGWLHYTPQDTTEHYSASGRLLSITNRAGLAHTLSYDGSGRLTGVTHTFGRTLTFNYDPTTGYLAGFKDPSQRQISFEHDGFGNLSKVTYPDTKTRQYHYEDVIHRFALTGITDERGERYVTWTYDHLGRVLSSGKPGGIELHTFRYAENQTIEIDPLGTERTYEFATVNDRKYLRKVTEPCGSCGGGVAAETIYDGRGLVESRKDFEGRITRYGRNSRGLIETLTEAAGTPSQRITSTVWHPFWFLPLETREPIEGGLRTTVFAYDNEGKLQSRTVTARTETRVWSTSFDANGQLLTVDGPRSDVSDASAWTYDPVSGNALTMTDAAGNDTHYTEYDDDARLKKRIDANGRITEYRYDLRGRMTHMIEKIDEADPGEITQFAYTPSGNIDRLTLADDSYLAYSYDIADRLTDVLDSRGRHVHYTLDPLGNRTKEETFDGATLVQVVNRHIDVLGRVEAVYGSDQAEATHYTYDDTGNEKTVTDALDHVTTQHYDALDRLDQTDVLADADPAHARIGYAYDAQDNLTRVTDPRNLPTVYHYTGFDELDQLTSPDTGITAHRYDLAGNLAVRTDARNQRGVYTYDALNRIKQIGYGAASAGDPAALDSVEETLRFNYDEASGGEGAKGRLTSLSDGAGSASLIYDRHGRVTSRTQSLGNGSVALTKSTGYHYDDAGRLDAMATPSGAVIGYAYGADGRVLTITVNGVTIVREIETFPFGESKAWTEGPNANGFRYERSFDTDGRIAHHTLGDANRQLGYDAAHRITSLIDTATPEGTTPATPQSPNWTFAYDAQDRLSGASNAATQGALAQLNLGWAYDATGNRSAEARNGAPSIYTTATTSNRLDAIDSTSRSYDAAGNTSSDGTYAYTYSARNRLTSARLQSTNAVVARYAINAFGERVCKADGASQCPKGPGNTDPADAGSGNFKQTVYDDAGHLLGEYEANGNLIAEHVWLDDTPVAVIKPIAMVASHGGQSAAGAAVFAVEPDHLDSPRVIANASHQIVWRWDSSPFGDTPANEAPNGLAAFNYSLRLPGQQYDAETKTHYNYFRDYEPGTGRYLESDPIGVLGGLTTYDFVRARVNSFIDPSGLKGIGVAKAARNQFDSGCGCSASKPVKISVPDRANWREAIDHAVGTDGPMSEALPLDRPGANSRRRSRTSGCGCSPGKDNDEWPPAFMKPLGGKASIRSIPLKANRGLGGFMGRACSLLPDGAWVQWIFEGR